MSSVRIDTHFDCVIELFTWNTSLYMKPQLCETRVSALFLLCRIFRLTLCKILHFLFECQPNAVNVCPFVTKKSQPVTIILRSGRLEIFHSLLSDSPEDIYIFRLSSHKCRAVSHCLSTNFSYLFLSSIVSFMSLDVYVSADEMLQIARCAPNICTRFC